MLSVGMSRILRVEFGPGVGGARHIPAAAALT